MFDLVTPPDHECRRDNQQGQDGRTDHTTDHGGCNAAHHFRAGTCTEHNRQQAGDDSGYGHHNGAYTHQRAFNDCLAQFFHIDIAFFTPRHFLVTPIGLVEIHQHEHANLDRDPGKRNKTHPDSNRNIIVQPVQKPDTAYQRQWQSAKNDQHLGKTPEIQIQQQDNDTQGHRNNRCQLLFGALHEFILA